MMAQRFFIDMKNGADQAWQSAHNELNRFMQTFIADLAPADEASGAGSEIKIVARSAASPVIACLADQAEQIRAQTCKMRLILAEVSPPEGIEALNRLFASDEEANSLLTIKWARHPALMDANEQLILGTQHHWAGNVLRRQGENSNYLDIFKENDSDGTRLARRAFTAMWEAAVPAPGNLYARFDDIEPDTGDEYSDLGRQLSHEQLQALKAALHTLH